jgi:hypothetical protein
VIRAFVLTPVVALLMAATAAFADGMGEIRIADRPLGAFRVTAATSPSPLAAGDVTVSLLVQDSALRQPVLDATVWVEAIGPAGHRVGPVQATAGAAANRLLYVAILPLSSPGSWTFTVAIGSPDGPDRITFVAAVGNPPPSLPLGLFAVVIPSAVVLVGFAWRTWVRRTRSHAVLS